PSYYDGSGDVVLLSEDSGAPIFPNVAGGSLVDLRDALTALIGRYSQYGVNLNYGAGGKVLPSGAGPRRAFATEEYDFYGQDTWRARPNLTLTYGLRWTTATPVYEAGGLQVKPTTGLGDFFDRRVAGAESGRPFNDPLSVDLAGKANN